MYINYNAILKDNNYTYMCVDLGYQFGNECNNFVFGIKTKWKMLGFKHQL